MQSSFSSIPTSYCLGACVTTSQTTLNLAQSLSRKVCVCEVRQASNLSAPSLAEGTALSMQIGIPAHRYVHDRRCGNEILTAFLSHIPSCDHARIIGKQVE